MLEQPLPPRGEDLLQGPGQGDAAVLEENDFGGNAPDFREVVRDVDDLQVEGEEPVQNLLG